MPLRRVTLTGADEHTSPGAMVELSKEFPFVEWGILIGSNVGFRMPSMQWIEHLVAVRALVSHRVDLSLHICGARLRAIASGKPDLHYVIGTNRHAFGRVQLNWHGERWVTEVSGNVLESFSKMGGDGGWNPEIIFQLDGRNDELWRGAGQRFRCSGLFDRSHGAGVVPGEWPEVRNDIPCGWAGGLGPDNVVQEFERIRQRAHPVHDFWIDMETKLYGDGGKFDLSKCRTVLELMSPFVGK